MILFSYPIKLLWLECINGAWRLNQFSFQYFGGSHWYEEELKISSSSSKKHGPDIQCQIGLCFRWCSSTQLGILLSELSIFLNLSIHWMYKSFLPTQIWLVKEHSSFNLFLMDKFVLYLSIDAERGIDVKFTTMAKGVLWS